MSVVITVDRLRLFARHGVMEQERRIGNEFEVTLRITYPSDVTRDSIDATLNYAKAVDVVREVMSEPSQLLEHVAWRISEALRSRFPAIEAIETTIVKLRPPIEGAELAGVGVTYSWP